MSYGWGFWSCLAAVLALALWAAATHIPWTIVP